MGNVIQFQPSGVKPKPLEQSEGSGKVLQYPIRYQTIEEKWFAGPPPPGLGTYSPPAPFGIDAE